MVIKYQVLIAWCLDAGTAPLFWPSYLPVRGMTKCHCCWNCQIILNKKQKEPPCILPSRNSLTTAWRECRWGPYGQAPWSQECFPNKLCAFCGVKLELQAVRINGVCCTSSVILGAIEQNRRSVRSKENCSCVTSDTISQFIHPDTCVLWEQAGLIFGEKAKCSWTLLVWPARLPNQKASPSLWLRDGTVWRDLHISFWTILPCTCVVWFNSNWIKIERKNNPSCRANILFGTFGPLIAVGIRWTSSITSRNTSPIGFGRHGTPSQNNKMYKSLPQPHLPLINGCVTWCQLIAIEWHRPKVHSVHQKLSCPWQKYCLWVFTSGYYVKDNAFVQSDTVCMLQCLWWVCAWQPQRAKLHFGVKCSCRSKPKIDISCREFIVVCFQKKPRIFLLSPLSLGARNGDKHSNVQEILWANEFWLQLAERQKRVMRWSLAWIFVMVILHISNKKTLDFWADCAVLSNFWLLILQANIFDPCWIHPHLLKKFGPIKHLIHSHFFLARDCPQCNCLAHDQKNVSKVLYLTSVSYIVWCITHWFYHNWNQHLFYRVLCAFFHAHPHGESGKLWRKAWVKWRRPQFLSRTPLQQLAKRLIWVTMCHCCGRCYRCRLAGGGLICLFQFI